MKRHRTFLTILCAIGLCGAVQGWSQDNVKLAQTGMQFLSVVSDARGSAMAGAMTALPMESASLFYNPGTMAVTDRMLSLSASYNKWIADIAHTTFSLSYRPANGDYGVIGVSGQFVDYGVLQGTVVSSADKGYDDTGDLKPYAVALGVGYAKSLSESFSVGLHVKWVSQSLGSNILPASGGGTEVKNNHATVLAFDFGTLFKTGFKSFAFGMSVRNFSGHVKFQDESFPLPLTFAIGLSVDAWDFVQDKSVVRSVFVDIDAIHNRDYREQLFIGVDCRLLGVLALRGGYIGGSDEAGATMGFGVQKFGLEADYAFTPFGVFDNVHRVTLRYSM